MIMSLFSFANFYTSPLGMQSHTTTAQSRLMLTRTIKLGVMHPGIRIDLMAFFIIFFWALYNDHILPLDGLSGICILCFYMPICGIRVIYIGSHLLVGHSYALIVLHYVHTMH